MFKIGIRVKSQQSYVLMIYVLKRMNHDFTDGMCLYPNSKMNVFACMQKGVCPYPYPFFYVCQLMRYGYEIDHNYLEALRCCIS